MFGLSLFGGGSGPTDLAGMRNSALTAGVLALVGTGGVLVDGPTYAAAVLTLTNAGGTASYVASGQLNSTFQLYNDAGAHNFLIQSKGSGSNQLRIQNDGATKATMNATGAMRFGDANAPALTLESAGAIGAATYAKVGSYTVATVPSASASGAGAMIWVTDAAAGSVLATSNGTVWKLAGTQTTLS